MVKQSLLFIIFFVLFAMCKQSDKVNFSVQQISDSEKVIRLNKLPTTFSLMLENRSSSPVTYYLTNTIVNLHSNDSIIQSLILAHMSDEQKAMALWEFLCEYKYHCRSSSLTNEQLHNPAMLLNSFGCGLCDDANAALVNLALLAGLTARVVGLSGHVVAEIFYNGQWHMFDADGRYFFKNRNGSVASVQEIEKDAGLLNNPNRKINWFKKWLLRKTICTSGNNYVDTIHKLIDAHYQSDVLLGVNDKITYRAATTTGLREFLINSYSSTFYVNRGELNKEVRFKSNSPITIELPYAQTGVNISFVHQFSGNVFYSPDSVRWFFRGRVNGSKASICFPTIGNQGEPFTFKYYLKFISDEKDDKVFEARVKSRFVFSDRALFNNPSKSFKIVLTSNAELNQLGTKIQVQ